MSEVQKIPVQDLEQDRDPIVEAAEMLVVNDQGTLEIAGSLLTKQIQPLLKKIDESCDPVCKATNASHKAAVAQRKSLREPLVHAKKLVDDKVKLYLDVKEERLVAMRAHPFEAGDEELPPPIEMESDKVEGMSSAKYWKAEVTDLQELVLAVASGDAPLSLLQIDQPKLNQYVKAMDGAVSIPGVRVWKERSIRSRAS